MVQPSSATVTEHLAGSGVFDALGFLLSGVNYSLGLTTTISPYRRQLPFSF